MIEAAAKNLDQMLHPMTWYDVFDSIIIITCKRIRKYFVGITRARESRLLLKRVCPTKPLDELYFLCTTPFSLLRLYEYGFYMIFFKHKEFECY